MVWRDVMWCGVVWFGTGPPPRTQQAHLLFCGVDLAEAAQEGEVDGRSHLGVTSATASVLDYVGNLALKEGNEGDVALVPVAKRVEEGDEQLGVVFHLSKRGQRADLHGRGAFSTCRQRGRKSAFIW